MKDQLPPRLNRGGNQKYQLVNGEKYVVQEVSMRQAYIPVSTLAAHLPPRVRKVQGGGVKRSYALAVRRQRRWSIFNDPEMKRRKRVAKYKFYAVEGKVKESFKKGLRWIKSTCSRIVHRGPQRNKALW